METLPDSTGRLSREERPVGVGSDEATGSTIPGDPHAGRTGLPTIAPAAARPSLSPARHRLVTLLEAATDPPYAVLDAARDLRALDWLKEEKAEYESLYDGDSARDLEMFAPYLVRFEPGAPLLRRLAASAWGESWGIYALSPLPLADVRKHFRRFLMVELDGKPVYFRFYDPRVLRIFLPTCTGAELREFFGPLKAWLLEGESPDVLLQFTLAEEGLVCTEIPLEGADVPDP